MSEKITTRSFGDTAVVTVKGTTSLFGGNCASCKHHSIKKVPRDVEVSFDEYIETSDEEVDFYICMHPNQKNKQIGLEPIHCDDYERSVKTDLSETDAMIAKFNARHAPHNED